MVGARAHPATHAAAAAVVGARAHPATHAAAAAVVGARAHPAPAPAAMAAAMEPGQLKLLHRKAGLGVILCDLKKRHQEQGCRESAGNRDDHLPVVA